MGLQISLCAQELVHSSSKRGCGVEVTHLPSKQLSPVRFWSAALMEEIIYSRCLHKNYIQYAVWTPDEYDGKLLKGPGAEAIVSYPSNEYHYFLEGEIDWNRILNRVKIKNLSGNDDGQGLGKDGSLPLFNILHSPPVVKILNSNKSFRPLSLYLIVVIYFDCIVLFNDGVLSDQYVSKYSRRFAEYFDNEKMKRITNQSKIFKNREENLQDWDDLIVKMEKNKIYNFTRYEVDGFVDEFKRRIRGHKNIDHNKNQMLLF